ncbi:MAG: hypothetical protein GX855_09880 [Firmicutes bacterium]|nr:hypothetical protein [Bacillota bacterium]
MQILLFSILAGLGTYLAMPAFLELLKEDGALRKNYRQDSVPVGGGFLFIWIGSVMGALLGLTEPWTWIPTGLGQAARPSTLLAAAALGYGLLGLLDDLVGTRKQTGLLGHGRALLGGQLTTGAVKAAAGTALGLLLAAYRLAPGGFSEAPWADGLSAVAVDGLLIAAAANTLNLFDLRPGRAGKVFLMGYSFVLLRGNPVSLVLLPWLGSLLGYLPYDLRGEVMMGDVGSNALGSLLGLASCYALALPARLAFLVLLILLHLLAERISFTEIIENHWLLHRLDLWGRKGP